MDRIGGEKDIMEDMVKRKLKKGVRENKKLKLVNKLGAVFSLIFFLLLVCFFH
jgi:hypothetical protein